MRLCKCIYSKVNVYRIHSSDLWGLDTICELVALIFSRLFFPFHTFYLFVCSQWVTISLGSRMAQNFLSPALLGSRWDKENTSSPGSLVLWLLLAWPIHLPVVTLVAGFLPILLPSCPPSKHWLIHSFPLSHSLALIHSPLPNLATREVCGTGASIIDRASV